MHAACHRGMSAIYPAAPVSRRETRALRFGTLQFCRERRSLRRGKVFGEPRMLPIQCVQASMGRKLCVSEKELPPLKGERRGAKRGMLNARRQATGIAGRLMHLPSISS